MKEISMDKLDYKKAYKELYLPTKSPRVIEIPSMKFIMLDGEGDPNGDEFGEATSALYSFSYAVKMSYKSDKVPTGFYDYVVFPLEGVWDLVDKTLLLGDKDNFRYKIMIRQPEFLTEELFDFFITGCKKKKPSIYYDKIEFNSFDEGLCCQMLHLGSYDSETQSFEVMEQFCRDNGYRRTSHTHREIYLSDPRRYSPDKLKTVLRFQVE